MSEFSLRCSECGACERIEPLVLLCPVCSSQQEEFEPLRGVLDVRLPTNFEIPSSPLGWLPMEREFLPDLPVGNTPLWQPRVLGSYVGSSKLWVKNDAVNPTGSLKDRASLLVCAWAKKYGYTRVSVASTGNAASSLAGVAAASGLACTVFMSQDAPIEKRSQVLAYGAELREVSGNYDAAYNESLAVLSDPTVLCRNTAMNPLTIEGKKTVSLEIFQQLGQRVPDCIFVPTGDGVILSGVYKGFSDLIEVGAIPRMPKIYAVQAAGSAAIAEAWKTGGFRREPLRAMTVADSLVVDVPRNGHHALRLLNRFDGECLIVEENAIVEAQRILATRSGVYAEPSAAVGLAGYLQIKQSAVGQSEALILVTGHGLKNAGVRNRAGFDDTRLRDVDRVDVA